MRIFIDTNIFLDVILKRENYDSSLIILNAVDRGIFEGVVLDVTLLNVDYIAKKQIKDLRYFLNIVNNLFLVVCASNKDIKKALEIDNNDLEDNLQYISAKKVECDLIITNDKDFYKGKLNIFSSVEFVSKYIK